MRGDAQMEREEEKQEQNPEQEHNAGSGLRDFAEQMSDPDLSRLECLEFPLGEIQKAADGLEFADGILRNFGGKGLQAMMGGENAWHIHLVLTDILPSFLGRGFYMERGYYGNNERLSSSGYYIRFDDQWERFDHAFDRFTETLSEIFPTFAGRIAAVRMHVVDYTNECENNNWHGENVETIFRTMGMSRANETYLKLRDEIIQLLNDMNAHGSEPSGADAPGKTEQGNKQELNDMDAHGSEPSGADAPGKTEQGNKRKKRGRPPSPDGAKGYAPSEKRKLVMIQIIEILRSGKVYKLENAVTKCVNEGIDAAGDFNDGGKMAQRWAKYNGVTITELRRLSNAEWEQKKSTLK